AALAWLSLIILKTTVCGSLATTSEYFDSRSLPAEALHNGFSVSFQLNTTSSAVNGVPSLNLASCLRWNVVSRCWSAPSPTITASPLSRVGTSTARSAIGRIWSSMTTSWLYTRLSTTCVTYSLPSPATNVSGSCVKPRTSVLPDCWACAAGTIVPIDSASAIPRDANRLTLHSSSWPNESDPRVTYGSRPGDMAAGG